MLTDCSDPREVADFHFLQLRTLRIAKENESVPKISGNILAAASKYGLVFTGKEGGFNVIKLETILTLDEDKENRSIIENYSCAFVPSGTPVTLSVNANQTTLAVCVKRATNIIINLYSLSAYCGSVWQPFCTDILSPSGAEVRDFVWNPAVESCYAVCFSDGSLQIHEVTGNSFRVIGNLQEANTVTVCWSPKGKQLVAGKRNGCFSQYKPNLTEVKTVLPPSLEGPVSVTSICWIANTVFAVVYVLGDCPNLFIVSTPKDSPCVYTNYYDVCLGNNSASLQKYLLHLEPTWGILVCASLDSIEIAVLGDMPKWVQWDLKEDGKALLPGKDGATHAIGMAVVYSAQRQLIISESESYPPMPVLLLLTNNGLLVSFHIVNNNSAAPSLVSAPLPLENENSVENAAAYVEVSPAPLAQSPSMSDQSLMSTFITGNQATADQFSVPQSKETTTLSVTQTLGKIENSNTLPVVGQREPSSLIVNGVHINKPEDITLSQNRTSPVMVINHSPLLSEKQNEVHPNTQNSYMTAIISEMQSFEKELQELKQLQASHPTIDGEEDMIFLKKYALNLHNFQMDILETMQSITSDIYTLKNVLLESFVMVEEACSRERRRNDHSYITMLKERALDPITAKRMQKMNQHFQYLSTQVQEVSDKLDQDWINLRSSKKKSLKSNMCISSTEAIYKTIVNNQKIIHNLRKKVDMLMKKSEERKLRNTTKSASWGWYHKRSMQEDLSKLADEFLQVKIVHPEECEPTVTKKLSQESQTVLKAFLKQSNVRTVRPTAVYSPSQSRLLSNVVPSEDFPSPDYSHEKVSSKQISTPVTRQEVPKLISVSSEAQIPKTTSKLPLSFDKTPPRPTQIAPVYEPITPPDDINSAVSVNKTFNASSIPGSPLTNEKQTELQFYHQPLFKLVSSIDSSASSYTDEGISRNTLSSIKSNIEDPSNIPCPDGGKPLVLDQTSSKSVSVTSTSLFSPKTLSFASSTPKIVESSASKPLTINNNTVVSSASKPLTINNNTVVSSASKPLTISNNTVVSSASSFPFTSSFGPKKEISFSMAPLSNAAATSVKSSSQIESESPQFSQTEVSNNTLSIPTSQTSSFISPVTKASHVLNPSLFTGLPENKSPTSSFITKNNKQSDAKSSVGFFFQKSTDNIDQSNVSTLTKNALSEISSLAAATKVSIPSVTLKTDVVDSKLPDSHDLSNQHKEVEKPVATQSPSIFSSDTSFATIKKTENSVTVSSQSFVTSTFSTFSDLKHLLPSVEVSASEHSVPSTTITSSSASETTVNTFSPATSDVVKTHSTASVTNTTNVISQSDLATSKPSTPPMPILSPITTTSAPSSTLFAQSTLVSPTSNSEVSSSVAASKTEPSTTTVFGGAKSPLVFGQSSTETSSFFGAANTFGQTPVTQSNAFGQPTTTTSSSFPSASGGFFSQMQNFGAPAASTTTTTSSDFNSQTSTFSFTKPAFGQTTGSFGLAKSFFGQNTTTPFTQAGSSTSFSFNQNQNQNQTSTNVFGQGSFFSGLGGKPSEESASKNVFGLSSNLKLNSDTNNLFRNSSVTSFGAVNSGSFSSPGSFSSGGGSVAQAGFGSFQQNTSPQSAGFVSAPSFGGAPSFGSLPAFGGSPTFGSGSALTSSIFNQQQQQVSSNFSSFVNASSPTFGSIASQSPGFGNTSPVSGFGSQGTTFGSSPVFGGSSFGGQSSSFGTTGSPSNSSAFTQWRN